MHSRHRVAVAALLAFLLAPMRAAGQDLKPIQLPPAKTEGGKALMDVLKARQSARVFASDSLTAQTLSNLLWAAFGINRPDGHRTAPSAMNWQEIDIYVTTADGAYLWDPKANALKPVAAGDLRAATGSQGYVGTAAVNLVYVADLARARGSAEQQQTWTWADAGFIAQNAYLYCASEGLVAVVRALIPRDTLAPQLKLRPDQKILLAQSIGHPKK